MDSGAVLAVTLQPANRGDTGSVQETFASALETPPVVAQDNECAANLHPRWGDDVVADK